MPCPCASRARNFCLSKIFNGNANAFWAWAGCRPGWMTGVPAFSWFDTPGSSLQWYHAGLSRVLGSIATSKRISTYLDLKTKSQQKLGCVFLPTWRANIPISDNWFFYNMPSENYFEYFRETRNTNSNAMLSNGIYK